MTSPLQGSSKSCCVICKLDIDVNNLTGTVTLGEKGASRINVASRERESDVCASEGQIVHILCRQKFTNRKSVDLHKKKISQEKNSIDSKKRRLRSTNLSQFSFKTHCLSCGLSPTSADVTFPVRTNDFDKSVKKIIEERNDDWANVVRGRIALVSDLHAADAIYHQKCSTQFRNIRFSKKADIVDTDGPGSKKKKLGRPGDEIKATAFLKVVDYIENNVDEQLTIPNIVDKMRMFLEGTDCEPYVNKYMKSKLQSHFGDSIIVTDINGKPSVVTYRPTAYKILADFHSQPKTDDPKEEKKLIIRVAAELIKSDISSADNNFSNKYPDVEQFTDPTCICESVILLLKTIFGGYNKNSIKMNAIGQAIMQAARPRGYLAPIQLGLAIQMHHYLGSRFLIDTLNSLGFCSSYTEVQQYIKNAALQHGKNILDFDPEKHFLQFVADNVDHNVRTLDGKGTFHGMGIIATITPHSQARFVIPRAKVSNEELLAVGKIPIKYYSNRPSQVLKYEVLSNVECTDATTNLNILWKSSVLCKVHVPSWSGVMQMLHDGSHPGKSSIIFLPMIDMSASDLSCIYSTLCFVADNARRYNVTPIITFDQPLWWKASTIIRNEGPSSSLKNNIILRLGGFHIIMSYLGTIGHLMAGSGIEEVFQTLFSANTVSHILNGDAYSRALRAHIMTLKVLYNLIASQIILCEESQCDFAEAATLFEQMLHREHEISSENVCSSDLIERISTQLNNELQRVLPNRTARLWIQYMHMVDIMLNFIKAERTGNWLLHLKSLKEMLPFFAASGHNNYTKSSWIYIQEMLNLKETFPHIYEKFLNGFHVIRRSERHWAGLSPDQVIEQVLMRSVKSNGGLTRGRGFTEMQRTVWLLSMPSCSEVNRTMQDYTGILNKGSEQHRDMTTARKARDDKDMNILLHYFENINPFSGEDNLLRNISTGTIACNVVNADCSENVGCQIIQSMIGKNVQEYIFKKKNQAVTIASQTKAKLVKIDGDEIQVDPLLLFQRLTSVLQQSSEDELAFALTFELSTLPTSLFDQSGIPRQAQKSALAHSIWTMINKESKCADDQEEVDDLTTCFVIDGGHLLHRIPWPKDASYEEICNIYVNYTTSRYCKTIVVFDGYESGPSTKDVTHYRRTGGIKSPTIKFEPNMKVLISKDKFLSNPNNKSRFIKLLTSQLQANKIVVHQAEDDADVLIAMTAVESSNRENTTLIGDDTDLLVLVCYHFHATQPNFNLIFKSEIKAGTNKQKTWDIRFTTATLGGEICNSLPFIHAIAGCDTTSRIFGIGKGVPLKRFKNDFERYTDVFNDANSDVQKIVECGEAAIVRLYNGQPYQSLNDLRKEKFSQKLITARKVIQPETLPPTSSACHYHSLRVYYQVQIWLGNNSLDPFKFGWMLSNNNIVPVPTDKQPAPSYLLTIIRCNCKRECSNLRCNCKKHGLDCSGVCGNCKGVSCANSPPINVDDSDDSGDTDSTLEEAD